MLQKFEVYQVAKQLHWECKKLKVPRFLGDQLLRASSSVVLNIAEGSGKRTPEDQAKFYSIAFGSLRECQAIIELEKFNVPQVIQLIDRLGAMLFKLSRKGEPKKTETKRKTERQQQRRTPDGCGIEIDAKDESDGTK